MNHFLCNNAVFTIYDLAFLGVQPLTKADGQLVKRLI